MTNAATIAKALDAQKFRSSGDGFVCRCPAHEDDQPSLKISNGKDGKILIHCHAGCEPRVVIDEIKRRGLWPEQQREQTQRKPRKAANDDKRRVVAKYEYFDPETGELRMQVLRWEPKTFSQRRPDPNRPGEWANQVSAEHRTLYNAPRVFRHDKVIFVVEGEKDVDNLAEIGVVATCNPGGATKWQDNYSEILRGKDVVLVPDNDDAGRKHTEVVGKALQGIAKRVRVLTLPDLPEKGDVSDWLAAGGTRAQLVDLVKNAPEWAPPVAPVQPPIPAANDNADDKPFQCLGYNKGSYYYLPKGQQQVVELSAAGHTIANMLGLTDYNWWMFEFPGSEKSPVNVHMAANWMMRTCERRGVWDPAGVRGRGAWFDDVSGRVILRNSGL
ncbi:MAG: toprim domain-containing protein [Novosphingobium sp.]|uniref:toprim domain-containing protein n=1 Tax=Novosphingobium sp. TaxID=1874826 RepID=UPI00301AE278